MNKAANRSQCTASSFSNMSMLHERGKTFDLIVEEDDPHHIEERLDEAETRLKILSMNTKSSVKELKRLFGTVERKPKMTHNRQTSAYSKSNSSQSHIQVIRHHLHLLEERMHGQQNVCAFESQQLEEHPSNLSIIKGRSHLKSYIDDHTQIQDELREYMDTNRRLQNSNRELEERIVQMRKSHKEELKELKINIENYYLEKEVQLVKEIQQLRHQLEQNQKQDQAYEMVEETVAKLTQERDQAKFQAREQLEFKRQLMVRVNELQTKVKQLEVKVKELQNQLVTTRSNNQRFCNQISELNTNVESYAREAIMICQAVTYCTEVLNRISNNQLLATVVMIKEELNMKKPLVRNLMHSLRSRCSLQQYDMVSTQRSGIFRMKEESNLRVRKFIDDKEHVGSHNTVLRSDTKNKMLQSTPLYLGQTEGLYHMLLAQSCQIEQLIQSSHPAINDMHYY